MKELVAMHLINCKDKKVLELAKDKMKIKKDLSPN